MPQIQYKEIQFRESSLAIIKQANQIIATYQEQGYLLTLRQLYYQFVARDLVPNTERSYKRLGSIINDARIAGRIDWSAIEDRTRNLQSNSHWSGPAEIISACANQFKLDLWSGQDYRPEVWIEKEALAGVLDGVCGELDVPYFACRGYVSQSEQWAAGMRFSAHRAAGFQPIVFHLGDHDPSGIDMTRDNSERLSLFAREDVEVRRLALNIGQIEEFNPPPNPAKVTDSRFESYQARFGEYSWELDALEPAVLVELVRGAVESLCDFTIRSEMEDKQSRAREQISAIADQFEEVLDFLEEND